jgi:hypothetical protein
VKDGAIMKAVRLVKNLCVALASVGLLFPHAGHASANEMNARGEARTANIIDVSLADGGMLRGQVVSDHGAVQPGAAVAVLRGKEVVATTTTDGQGQFTVAGMKGGMYVVAANGTASVVRAWAPHTAPPAAVQGVLLVPPSQSVRAQGGGFVNEFGLASLALAGLIVGVIWVAVEHNNDAS